MMTEPDTLSLLASRVARLSPDWRDPERFHMDKDDIAKQLRRVARDLERNAA